MALDPNVWGPHYWFVLQSMAVQYPITPNEVTKKKYYDFIQNLPLFIPHTQIGNDFSEYLDKYPVTPYLDSRDSFIKWVNFIHNKINMKLGKPLVSIEEGIQQYYDLYKPKEDINAQKIKLRQQIAFTSILCIGFVGCYYFYYK